MNELEKPVLNLKQEAFIERLLSTIPYNLVGAYVAVYGDKGNDLLNRKLASQVLSSPKVKEYKRIREKEIIEEQGCNASVIARKLVQMGLADKDDKVYTPSIQLKALDLLQKQLGIQTNKQNITADINEQVVIINDMEGLDATDKTE